MPSTSLIARPCTSTPFPLGCSNSIFSCWAIAWAETISASRFRRGVCSPIPWIISTSSGNINDYEELLTWRCISFQCSDYTRLRNLVRAGVLHVNCCEKQHIALFRNSWSNGFHYFAIDGLFVVSHEILVKQLLYLVGWKPVQKSVLVRDTE